jgi:hypothetical protein
VGGILQEGFIGRDSLGGIHQDGFGRKLRGGRKVVGSRKVVKGVGRKY